MIDFLIGVRSNDIDYIMIWLATATKKASNSKKPSPFIHFLDGYSIKKLLVE